MRFISFVSFLSFNIFPNIIGCFLFTRPPNRLDSPVIADKLSYFATVLNATKAISVSSILLTDIGTSVSIYLPNGTLVNMGQFFLIPENYFNITITTDSESKLIQQNTTIIVVFAPPDANNWLKSFSVQSSYGRNIPMTCGQNNEFFPSESACDIPFSRSYTRVIFTAEVSSIFSVINVSTPQESTVWKRTKFINGSISISNIPQTQKSFIVTIVVIPQSGDIFTYTFNFFQIKLSDNTGLQSFDISAGTIVPTFENYNNSTDTGNIYTIDISSDALSIFGTQALHCYF